MKLYVDCHLPLATRAAARASADNERHITSTYGTSERLETAYIDTNTLPLTL